jgi:hypothetical protein
LMSTLEISLKPGIGFSCSFMLVLVIQSITTSARITNHKRKLAKQKPILSDSIDVWGPTNETRIKTPDYGFFVLEFKFQDNWGLVLV